MKATTRRAGRLLAALALVAAAGGCGNGDAGADTRSGPGPSALPTPTPAVTLTPRPPGPPVYHPLPHFQGPNPVDVKFAMNVAPYHGLTIGSRFTVVLTYTSKERRTVVISPNIQIGNQLIVKVMDAAGGKVGRVDNHDPATNGKYPFYVRAVDFENWKLKPGTTKIRVVIELIDVMCPGGGDFISEVSGGVGRVIKRGSNGGRHLVWVENDAADYAKMRAAQGTSNTAPPHSVCRPQSVE